MKISVYIPSFNQKAYLAEAIESVLAQTLTPHQIILIDDCSTDGSQELIAAYARRYPQLVTAIYRDQNQGIGRTRIEALQAVTGDYVTYVDGDDRYLPSKLEKESRAIRDQPDAQIAFSNYVIMDAQGVRMRLWADDQQPPVGYVFREVFLRQFPRGSLFRSELVRYDALKEVGYYDSSLNLYEDWELRIRLAKRFRTVYVDEPLSEYRRHPGGLSAAKLSEHVAAWEYIGRKSRVLLDDLECSERRNMETEFARLCEQIRARSREQANGERRKRADRRMFQRLKRTIFNVLGLASDVRAPHVRVGPSATHLRGPTATPPASK